MKDRPAVYLVGISGKGHPGGGRFPAFSRYMDAVFVGSPLGFRFFTSRFGRWVDRRIGALCGRQRYGLGLLVMELAAGLHMLLHRDSVYHSLKGEVDLHLLPRLSRRAGTHLVATFHDAPTELASKQVPAAVVRELAGVILLSESQRPYFEGLLPPERIFHVPHGVDVELFRPAPELGREPVVVAVGSYSRDYETLAKAMPLAWKGNPRVRFVLIGTRQADPNIQVPRLDDPRVELVDDISDDELVAAYQAAAVAVVPLLDATANNAVLEAMACGLPVVATDVGGIREYLGEEAGVLCPFRDARALANGVLRLLADRPAAVRMGAAGRARALRLFDYRVVVEQLRASYAKARLVDRGVPTGSSGGRP